MTKIKSTISIIILIIIIYILTINHYTSPYKIQMAIISLLALLFYIYLIKKKGGKISQTKTFFFFVTTFVLFLVASTGWFFSPFFFSLYLLSVLLGFIFIPSTSVGFIITLVVLFSFNIGEIDIAYDFLVVLSLLTVIPLTFYLKKEYLRLKEAEKGILIMRTEEKEFQNKVENLLANKVNNFAVSLRQPINDIKQLSFLLKKEIKHQDIEKYSERIRTSAEESLRLLNKFEQLVTGNKLLETPKSK